MQYRLRTLVILLAAGPPVLAAMWFMSRDDDFGLFVASLGVLAAIIGFPLGVVIALAERRKYLLDRDRRDKLAHKSNLFNDDWPAAY